MDLKAYGDLDYSAHLYTFLFVLGFYILKQAPRYYSTLFCCELSEMLLTTKLHQTCHRGNCFLTFKTPKQTYY